MSVFGGAWLSLCVCVFDDEISLSCPASSACGLVGRGDISSVSVPPPLFVCVERIISLFPSSRVVVLREISSLFAHVGFFFFILF